ncbi:fructosyl amino acid oxidase [Heliocybe sulcata]|uniref:Fructosyl amino acid oxidase n=1 Tax=Heliocybe sulcata TaxID=5364 RepID=A0A5C3N7L2_9AGAM|nr:fructosyl amino acid oxidase [Heliocybe sulcata]
MASSSLDKDARILIVGAGTFGLSTAFHLVERGYTNATCMDRWEVPSKSSAGWDLSKVARTEYGSPVLTRLAHESLDAWRELEPFASEKLFHQTGWIHMNPPHLGEASREWFMRSVENTRRYGDVSQIEDLPDEDAIKAKCDLLTGDLQGWSGIFNGNAGWVEAMRSMQVLGEYCAKRGVKFVSGPSGVMKELIHDGQTNNVIGVLAEDGTKHLADRIILATGGWSESLLDFEGQLVTVSYGYAHIQLTKEETQKYARLPVLHALGSGFCFPPTADGIYKIAGLPYTLTNYTSVDGRRVSVPRDKALNPTDTLPEECVDLVRRIARACLPELAERPVVYSAMCWDTESIDMQFIISPQDVQPWFPSSPSTLYIATAGSGHAFKNLPVLGKYVCDCLEGTLPEDLRELWRWRPDKVADALPEKRVDIKDLHGWRHDGKSEKDE